MKLFLNTKELNFYFKNFFLTLYIPKLKVGYRKNFSEDEDIWVGIEFNIKNEISYERYEYGKIIGFIILGFGVKITKLLL